MAFLFLLQGCSKDSEKSYEYWSELANLKLKEIENISSSYTCNDMDKISFKNLGCSYYVLLHERDTEKFNVLWKSYEELRSKAETLRGPSYYSVICIDIPPFRIDCIDNKPTLITVSNINIEEINSKIAELKADFNTYQENSSCINPNDWTYAIFNNGSCELEYIPIPKAETQNAHYYTKYNLLNTLYSRKKMLESSTCIPPSSKQGTVKCVNNKATVVFE